MPKPPHFLYSKHALEQINHRGLSKDTIDMIIRKPDHILPDSEDVAVYQKLVKEEDKHYLYRVFVNKIKNPPVIITAYKTSKTDKYENPV